MKMICGPHIAPDLLSVTYQADLAYITPSLTNGLYGVLSLEQRSSETSLRSNTFQIISYSDLCLDGIHHLKCGLSCSFSADYSPKKN